MPASQQGQYDKRNGKHAVRYYLPDGTRKFKGGFASKSAARQWFRDNVEPILNGEQPRKPDISLSDFIVLYLVRHGADVRPRTRATLEERLRHADARFGTISGKYQVSVEAGRRDG